MKNSSAGSWQWTSKSSQSGLTFKFLVNDQQWADGENIEVKAPGKYIYSPTFTSIVV